MGELAYPLFGLVLALVVAAVFVGVMRAVCGKEEE